VKARFFLLTATRTNTCGLLANENKLALGTVKFLSGIHWSATYPIFELLIVIEEPRFIVPDINGEYVLPEEIIFHMFQSEFITSWSSVAVPTLTPIPDTLIE